MTWLQVREKDLPARSVHALARRIVERAGGDRVLVNDRVDVALAAGCGGVHLTASSVSPRDVRRLAPGLVIGASVHGLDAALRAEDAGADFLVLAPIFRPSSKEPRGAPLGIDVLLGVRRRVRIPVLPLGGVTRRTLLELRRAGVRDAAGISLFMRARDPARLLRQLRGQA